ncbi:hypothetical protein [Halobacillus litoralis]|uniref:hypothetical protein n=1 Tax=Halobacillus litoralis TaxID=45668 RepID=UPI0024935C04|nr:hypothetical protein [Halobacillus litoralis]
MAIDSRLRTDKNTEWVSFLLKTYDMADRVLEDEEGQLYITLMVKSEKDVPDGASFLL